MCRFFLIWICCLPVCILHAQSEKEKIAVLNNELIPLRFDSLDFSSLDSAIQDKQFVFLSDGHTDGTTKYYFTQFIKYLHEQHGFNVLLLESSLYSSSRTFDRIRESPERSIEMMQHDLIPFIADCKSSVPLFDYLSAEVNNSDPLYFSGFDIGVTNNAQILQAEFYASFLASRSPVIYDTTYRSFMQTLDSIFTYNGRYDLDSLQKQFMFHYADSLVMYCENEFPADSYWTLIAQNVRAYLKGSLYHTPIYNSDIRNFQMYENVKWLMKIKYPSEKFIIWASPAHLAEGFFPDEKSMANLLYQDFDREEVFYLAATAYSNADEHQPKFSLPWELHQTGIQTGLLLFQMKGEDELFFNNTKESRFFDALLFIDKIEPCEWSY